ncbi:unnamed protein product, partial [Polarella glacialis]
ALRVAKEAENPLSDVSALFGGGSSSSSSPLPCLRAGLRLALQAQGWPCGLPTAPRKRLSEQGLGGNTPSSSEVSPESNEAVTSLALARRALAARPPLRRCWDAVFRHAWQLRELQLGSFADDALLSAAGSQLPSLQRLDVSESLSITDEGIRRLAEGCKCLLSVDLTHCHGTTYGSVFWLRQSSQHPDELLIRRQPAWLDGVFECPWGEKHMYWPDGTFCFSRDRESEGWVSRLWRRTRGGIGGRAWLEDRMTYCDLRDEQKGVQLMLPEGEDQSCEAALGDDDASLREVRVVQWFSVESGEGDRQQFPSRGVWGSIPLGRSVLAQMQDGGQVLLSRMKVRPLADLASGSPQVAPPEALRTRLWRRLACSDQAVAEELGFDLRPDLLPDLATDVVADDNDMDELDELDEFDAGSSDGG